MVTAGTQSDQMRFQVTVGLTTSPHPSGFRMINFDQLDVAADIPLRGSHPDVISLANALLRSKPLHTTAFTLWSKVNEIHITTARPDDVEKIITDVLPRGLVHRVSARPCAPV